ncbi:DUF1636 family protein [Ensifer sp. LCM 4579]|uniref:DUF1636 family protein n=1 Tax=Ensifer sp. LCM 4579 TaxID=1848292 RepID=UPI0008DA7285|nr:DUF1636 family protein [Ensifer sp. LCM 4579]OHV77955.1 hypothetical protein LCM4579_06285 [Ensifer sp. LCM 4579]
MANSHQSAHKITLSTECHFTGGPCLPGARLLAMLNGSISALGKPLADDFAIAGTVCMAACTRPCTIAFRASGRATYLFGDVAAEENIDDLVDFAVAHADGGVDGGPSPAGGGNLARVPAALIVSEALAGHFQ